MPEKKIKNSTVEEQISRKEPLIEGIAEPTVPISKVVRMIEAVLPNRAVQRSWSLGPQLMCQELTGVLYRLRSVQERLGNERKQSAIQSEGSQ